MGYILCIPDIETATYEDCERINQVMKRLQKRNIIQMESEPTYFKNYNAPDNCRKYRFYLEANASIAEIKRIENIIQSAYGDKKEYAAMNCCEYYFGEKGCITPLYYYLKLLEQEVNQIGAGRASVMAA